MAAQRPRRGGSQIMLYSLAGLLGAVGIGFLVAALLASRGGGSPVRSSVALPETTASPVSGVEGAQSTPNPTATIAAIPTLASTDPATEAPVATSTPIPAPADTPAPAPTPVPPAPAPAPTEANTEEPAPAPNGPFLIINGPAAAAVGEQAQFSASVHPEPLTVIWKYLGQETAHFRFVTVTFPSAGCFPVELTAIYSDGSTMNAVAQVTVGDASCP